MFFSCASFLMRKCYPVLIKLLWFYCMTHNIKVVTLIVYQSKAVFQGNRRLVVWKGTLAASTKEYPKNIFLTKKSSVLVHPSIYDIQTCRKATLQVVSYPLVTKSQWGSVTYPKPELAVRYCWCTSWSAMTPPPPLFLPAAVVILAAILPMHTNQPWLAQASSCCLFYFTGMLALLPTDYSLERGAENEQPQHPRGGERAEGGGERERSGAGGLWESEREREGERHSVLDSTAWRRGLESPEGAEGGRGRRCA